MTILKSALFSFVLSGGSLMTASGCSSVMTHTGGEPGYYPGTRASVAMLQDDDTGWAMTSVAAIDLPFSAVLDTLLLPYDYFHDTPRLSLRDRVDGRNPPQAAANATPH